MRLFITGAAGFIGSHLTEKLLDQKYEVIGVDNFDPFYDRSVKEKNLSVSRNFKNFHFFEGDILDRALLDQIFRKQDIEIVVHLAAKAGVRPSISDPLGYYRTNVEGTLNLLEVCRRQNVKKFIFASSSSVYGNNKKVPFSEIDNVDFPISPYAATKKAAELLCYNYHHLYDINVFALRFFTVYGPRQRPDLAIHKFFKLLYDNQPIPIFGDGNSSRDYTYIDDILDGLMKSIERIKGFEIINLGESEPIKLNDLINLIEEVTGRKVLKQHLENQPGDVFQTYADIRKAKKILDYHPTTPMKIGLRKFNEWFISQSSGKI